ncbi:POLYNUCLEOTIDE ADENYLYLTRANSFERASE FAMILY PROTEIN-RELATED [Salix purpurea]|uniref:POLYNUCLEOTIDE ADENYLYLTRANSFERASE FAMILY PROTEIN-RELATED n=1 Tax=Salix purpurea TaxID=77065 RepID=A0A9Q0W6F2_SALPP|nr:POLYNUCLEOTIDE ADENYLYLTRANSFERASE FAMILY PROTEIN-RELATED [Salix purpurea]
MAISRLSFACRHSIHFRPSLFHCFQKVRFSSVAAIETLYDQNNFNKDKNQNLGDPKPPEWKKWNSKELGISNSTISRPTRKVLDGLKKNGYEVYLVGGCVRDLILKRTPKDFDIITSAKLTEVVRAFPRCIIVGKRFPICHVHIGDTIVEVSSFSTTGPKFKVDLSNGISCPIDCNEKDYVRWKNCLRRDLTINGLMFDPYKRIVYDYMGGLEDIKKAKVRTVIPASTSFQEDCARILRAVRIAARLGFRFTRETAHFIKNLSRSLLRLDNQRIMMEMNYMLAYGSAEASLRILWKFGLLELLLPFQAAYFVRDGFKRRDKRSNMLLCLFSNLDKHLAPDRPCHSSLWVGILAFHKALSDQPRDPMVVAAFCLAVHNGGDILGGVKMVKNFTKPHDDIFHELSEPQNLDSEALADEIVDFAASVKQVLYWMTNSYYVSQAMAEYPQAPCSDLVFFPLPVYLKVCRIFECSRQGSEKGFMPKQGRKINYEMLALGSLEEVRHTFARVVFDTVFPLNLT